MACTKNGIVYETLKKEISDRKFSKTVSFPSERCLMNRFGVSRQTVRQSLKRLEEENLIFRRRGSGTFLTSVARRMTGRIGLIIHGVSYCEIFAPIARALSQLCQENDYTLLFTDISYPDDQKRVAQVAQTVREYLKTGVDGIIFQPIELIHDAEKVNRVLMSSLDAAAVPVVLLDSDISLQRSTYDLVSVDHFDAGRRLAGHLRETGARRIAYLMQRNRAPCVQERRFGVQVGSAGLPLPGEILIAEPDDLKTIRRFVAQKRPDAFACFNDIQAAMLIKTLAAIGKRVPKDIRVAGFDDVDCARFATPALTTMHQPCSGLAELALEMLMARIRNPGAPARETFLTAPLVVRGSTTCGRPSARVGQASPRRTAEKETAKRRGNVGRTA